MINLLMAFGFLLILLVINKLIYHYPSWPQFIAMLLVSLPAGLVMDYVFGYKLGLWYYVHHQWWSLDYYYNLLPAWAMVLTIFILFYTLLEFVIKNAHLRLTIYFIVICGQQEAMGVWRNSWQYNAPLPLIIAGWIAMLECCILVKKAIDWFGAETVEIRYYHQGVSQLELQ